jgi:hypothetical protein
MNRKQRFLDKQSLRLKKITMFALEIKDFKVHFLTRKIKFFNDLFCCFALQRKE